MNEQISILASLLGVLLLAAGCSTQDTSGRAIKMQSQSGKAYHNTDFAWFAICKSQTHGGHVGEWKGPPWRDKERAMQNACDHNKENPGHNAVIDHD